MIIANPIANAATNEKIQRQMNAEDSIDRMLARELQEKNDKIEELVNTIEEQAKEIEEMRRALEEMKKQLGL